MNCITSSVTHVKCIENQPVKGDGRCLYRSIAQGLFEDQELHLNVGGHDKPNSCYHYTLGNS